MTNPSLQVFYLKINSHSKNKMISISKSGISIFNPYHLVKTIFFNKLTIRYLKGI